MLHNTPIYRLVLGFGLCSLGSAMFYAYFKMRNDDKLEEKEHKKRSSTAQQQQQQICSTIIVNNDHVPLIFGRGGANKQQMELKSGAQIRLRDRNNGQKYCDISGLPAEVQAAHLMLIQVLERAPIVKVELQLTQCVANRINGRGGELIQDISRRSLAKLCIEPIGCNGKAKVKIVGNQQQVNMACKLLDEQVEEAEQLRLDVDELEQQREPRRALSFNCSRCSSQTSLGSQSPRNQPMEIYVSAVATPTKFWMQLVGPQSKQLDDMVQEMSSYYSSAEHRARHQLNAPDIGQIVAAIFTFDKKWYRAVVVALMPKEQLIEIYFVDYGDSVFITPADICELRTDFLTLRFQAVECFLANIKSTIKDEPNNWPRSAISQFEQLTAVGHWRKLIARIVTYKERPEGTSLPGLELFDVTESAELNIGELLISQGFALPLDDAYPLCLRSSTPNIEALCATPSIEELCATIPLNPHCPNDVESVELEHFADQLQLKLNDNIDLNNNPIKMSQQGDVAC